MNSEKKSSKNFKTVLYAFFAIFLVLGSGFAFAGLGVNSLVNSNSKAKTVLLDSTLDVSVDSGTEAETNGSSAESEASADISFNLWRERAEERHEAYKNYISNVRVLSGEAKVEARNELRERARLMLVAQQYAIISRLEALNERFNGNIETAIEFHKNRLMEIEDSNIDSNFLIDYSHRVNARWIELKHDIRFNLAVSINNKFNALINKGHVFSERFQAQIQKIEDKNIYVARLEAGLEIFNKDLNRMENAYLSLKAEFEDANTAEEKEKVVKKAFRVYTVAKHRLMEDFRLLRALINHSRVLEVNANASSEELVEIETDLQESSAEFESELAAALEE